MGNMYGQWCKLPSDDYASCMKDLELEPEFQGSLETLLQDTATFEQQERYRLDIDDFTHLRAVKYTLDDHLFYELQLFSEIDDNAILNYNSTFGLNSDQDSLMTLSSYMRTVLEAQGLPKDFKSAYNSMVVDMNKDDISFQERVS